MPTAERFIELSPVHVVTTFKREITDAGMRGTLLPVASDHESLSNYRSLNALQDDYDIDTPIWNQANAYFKGSADGSFFVMNFEKDYKAPTPKLDGVTTTEDSATVALSSSISDGLIHALSKYYYAGQEYILYPITSEDDKATALTLSNLVEAQDRGLLILSYATDPATTPDFSFLQQIKSNRATKVVSSTTAKDPLNTAAAEMLGKYVELGVGANFKFIENLGIEPQDQYEFTADSVAAYDKFNVATYATEHGINITTNGRTMSGISLGIMVTKDALINSIIDAVYPALHPDGSNRLAYDETTLKLVQSLIMGVFNDYQKNELIESYTVTPPDYATISDEKKASGVLDQFAFTWKPMRTVDDVEFSQTLVITDKE